MINRIVWTQCLLAATVTIGFVPYGRVAVLSAFIGSINSLVPTTYFAHKVLHAPSGETGNKALGVWFRAEVAKIAIVCGLFIAAFLWLRDLDNVALFTGFIVVHIGGVLASMTLDPYRD